MFFNANGGRNMNSNVGIILAFMCLIVFLLIWAVNIYRDRYFIKSMYIDWRTKWAYDWLMKHDFKYQQDAISREIVRQREIAYSQNDHDKADRIDRFSVAKEMGIDLSLKSLSD